MFKDITPGNQSLSARTASQNEKKEMECFRLRVIKEDDRTRERSSLSSSRAKKTLDLISETLEDTPFKYKTKEFWLKKSDETETEADSEFYETQESSNKNIHIGIDEL